MEIRTRNTALGDARALYEALLRRDASFDGSIYYGITSTGIFCRPICTARKPKFENTRYFSSVKSAMEAGFRSCKICRPMETRGLIPKGYRDLLRAISDGTGERIRDVDLRVQGFDPDAVRRWFKQNYGVTFQAMARAARLANALDAIRCGIPVTEAVFKSGFGSLSGFTEAARNATGKSPRSAARTGVIWITRFDTPLGMMVAGEYLGKLCLLEFADRRALEHEISDLERYFGGRSQPGYVHLHEIVHQQLLDYFDGKRRIFDIPLELPGSEFQRTVWTSLMEIPFGKVCSYKDQANTLGKPEAVRAVARANGSNRVAIIVPCHRVIGTDGSLTGYGGGLPRKQALLDLESRTCK
jgi:AraC family transcriptional regulator of adaptative response/methylated-DNA-[protein]-cysteine methyltransferase